MEKSKLGISLSLLGALAYFAAVFSGIFPLLVLLAYVFLREEDAYLKKNVLRALLLYIIFSVLINLVKLIPGGFAFLDEFFNAFYWNTQSFFLIRMVGSIADALKLLQTLLFILLGIATAAGKQFKIPFVDAQIDKHI